jgi:RNA polymerase sigma-70 factor (ECF subfamily)
MKSRTPSRRPEPADAETDDAILMRAGAGDYSAWPTLVARHLPAIVSLAWYKLGDRAEAEDVAQETFIRLMKKAETWQEDGAQLKTWLYRVALNLCIDRHRVRKHLPMDRVTGDAEASEVFDRMDDDLDRTRIVRRCLAELPERQQSALALVYYQGLSNREAADLLEVSVEAVESLLSRGRRTLKDKLTEFRLDGVGE